MLTKKEILNEVIKQAKNNDGVPLGWKRFEAITGIKPYDWGKFWPRFGDVLKEAGFKPNKLRGAFSEEYLFEKLIILIRELGKFPVKGDFRVKKQNNSDFPNDKTFNRFGSKEKLVTKLLAYASSEKYEDIIKICQNELIKFKKLEETEKPFGDEKFGTVYLAKSGRYYKIGRTNEMGRRHHEITIQLPEELELIHQITTDDPSGVEAYWHRRFSEKHKNGEWFDLGSSDVRAFKRWKRIA